MCARLRQGCVVQEIVSSAEKDSEAAVCQLLSKHTIDATPECEEEDSTSESQPPGTRKQQLDSYMESSGPVPSGAAKVTFSLPSQKISGHGTNGTVRFKAGGARIVMPVVSLSKVHSVTTTNTC